MWFLLAEKLRERAGIQNVSCLYIFLKGLQLLSSKFVIGKIKYAFVGSGRGGHQCLRPSFLSFFTYGQIFLSVLSRLAY